MPNGNTVLYWTKKKKKDLQKDRKSNEEHDTQKVGETSKQDIENEKIHWLKLFEV